MAKQQHEKYAFAQKHEPFFTLHSSAYWMMVVFENITLTNTEYRHAE